MAKQDSLTARPAVAIIGAPNVGKSSLVNALMDDQSAVIAAIPHTTRQASAWFYRFQDLDMGFVDTPGIEKGKRAVSPQLASEARKSTAGAALVIATYDRDKTSSSDNGLQQLLQQARDNGSETIAVLNKVDLLRDKNALLPRIQALSEDGTKDIVPVSAKKGTGIQQLRELISTKLQQVSKANPNLTRYLHEPDREARALQRLRRHMLMIYDQEIPHMTRIELEKADWGEQGGEKIRLHFRLHAARPAHQAILIGKQGARLGELRQAVTKTLSRAFNKPVVVRLHVRVERSKHHDQEHSQP